MTITGIDHHSSSQLKSEEKEKHSGVEENTLDFESQRRKRWWGRSH
jgi:hypothetical protein